MSVQDNSPTGSLSYKDSGVDIDAGKQLVPDGGQPRIQAGPDLLLGNGAGNDPLGRDPVIDLGLPEMSGIDIIRQVREDGHTYPILILTARDRWEDKVDGLSAGADDYVVKPFHFEEVNARVTALLRRSGGWASSELVAGPITLDMSRQEVRVDQETIDLTSFEYKIIEYLMVRAGQVISKAELTDRLYDQDFERDSNVIEVFIGRLRKKLDPANTIKPIETLRGRGYRFALERNQVD